MSVRKTSEAVTARVPLLFGLALFVMCLVWFFGIATRVSLSEENNIVALAGISRVLTGGFSDFRDTTFLVCLAIGCYFVCLWALNKRFRYDFQLAIAGTVLASLAMLPAMPLTSPDAVHLAADVRTLWIYDTWPGSFDGVPARFDDPVHNEVRAFRNAPSGYGPVAYAIGGAPIPFAGDDFKANLFGQKVLGAIFLTLTAVACGMLAKKLGQNAALVTGIVGLNPMMTWQFAADGHNDAMMAFFGVIAIWLVGEASWKLRGGGVAVGIVSVLTKFSLLLASPIVAAYWWPRWRTALAFLVAASAAGLLLVVIVGTQVITDGTMGPAGAVIETSPWHWLEVWFDTGEAGRNRIVIGSYILYVFILGLILLYHPLETHTDLIAAVGLAMTLFLYFCSPGYHPWYIVWCLPFAAMSGRRWLIAGAVAFSLGAFLPILALNWQLTLRNTANVPAPVDTATAAMWIGTAIATWIAWRGRKWMNFSSAPIGQRPAPRFAARQRKRARA